MIPVVTSIGGLLVIVIVAGIVFWFARSKRNSKAKMPWRWIIQKPTLVLVAVLGN